MSQLHDLTALEQAAAVRTGQVSPTELVEHALGRIEALDDRLGAFITVTPERALAAAAEAEQRLRRGGELPPLLGVPIAIKDLNNTAGVRTTFGSRVTADFVPDVDDAVVTKLAAAGTISLGKTNMPGYGFPAPTHGRTGIGALLPNVTISQADLAGFLTTRDALADLPAIDAGQETDVYTGPPRTEYQRDMRAGLTTELYNHYAARLSPQNLARIRRLAPGQDWRDLPHELLPPGMQRALRKDHTRRYRRMTWHGVPRSVITRFRDPKTGEYTHPEQDRTLSIREAARLQGFPDRFRFLGDRTSQYEQVGNAVPVPLAQAVAAEVARCLNGKAGPRLDHPFRRRPVAAIGRRGELLEGTAHLDLDIPTDMEINVDTAAASA